MESVSPASIALGILVEKEIVVQTVDNANISPERDSVPPHRPSVVSVVQSAPDLRRKTRTAEPEMIPPLSFSSVKMVPRSDGFHEERMETLADFFRSPPPPGNLMSIPDNLSGDSIDGRWSMLKAFRKKRKSQNQGQSQKPRRPPLIVLPDSAVSARTTSGHRYIAISIPSGQLSSRPVLPARSPVTGSMEAEFHRALDARLEPIRSMTFDRGKRILNTTTVDRESSSSISLDPRSSTRAEEATRLAPPPRRLSTVPSEETPSAKGKEPDMRKHLEAVSPHIAPMSALGSVRKPHAAGRRSISPKRERRSKIDRQKTPEPDTERILRVVEIPPTKRDGRTSQEKQISQPKDEPIGNNYVPKGNIRPSSKSPGLTPRTLSANPLTSLALPARTSSKNAGTSTPGSSGLGYITSQPTPESQAIGSNNEGNGNGDRKDLPDGPRGSFAESLVTTESSPKLCKAEAAVGFQSVPIVVRPPSRQEIDSPLNLNFPSPPSSRMSRSTQRDLLSPPRAAERSASRKDRVRERKQRDIEKLKAQIRQIQSPSTHLKPDVAAETLWPESPVLGHFSEGPTSASQSRPLPTSKRSDVGPIRPGQQLKSPYLSPHDAFKKRRGRSSSAPILTSSSSPSPLESPSMPWEGSTSYFRRKERQAEREEQEARKTRYAAHALAEEQERQKLLRRYEKLKESRAKDMEKRMHRLERNGEVLMQSLISMTETLNKIMQNQQTLQQSISGHAELLRPHGRRQSSAPEPERAQSLRSAQSDDKPFEALRLRPPQRNRPSNLGPSAGEASIRGGELGEESPMSVRQAALEALQKQLQATQSHSGARARGDSSYTSSSTSSSISSEAVDLEIVEPLLQELQEAAEGGNDHPAEEGKTPLSESEVFNLF
ncbi:hypothetical protein F4821DRAFT_88917 [Hypoxylon rubiginosum]|uniref:Uncharacterized protein n=1 Tax=Hypoxylon rubiginosum TaxID=110542 RepID=A0ACC0D721_9PEZI|nr:hypothetical protein F4821DRAFT_88917 [Hypoxylon rubiginosum]